MASVTYNRAKSRYGTVNLANLQVLLAATGYTPNPDHATVAAVTNELSGTGYTRKALTGVTVTVDDTNDRAQLSADLPVWTGADFGTPAWAVVFEQVTDDDDSVPLFAVDLAGAPTSNGGSYTVRFGGAGASGVIGRFS